MSETVVQVCHEAVRVEPKLRFLLLTLTVRNCSIHGEVDEVVDDMFRAWRRFSRLEGVKQAVKGWFRSLEVTVNHDKETAHPHFHVLLAVGPSYFGREYVKQAQWAEWWQQAAGVDYRPVVDIRVIRPKSGGMAGAVREVAKYAVKPADYLIDDGPLMADLVGALDDALEGRRLIAYGGCLQMAYKRLLRAQKVENEETGDLVHVGDAVEGCTCSACGSDLVEHVYSWRMGVRQYVG